MSWIVVLESEGRQADSIRDALVEDGWQVDLASTSTAATAAVASRSAQLVIANAELPGAPEFLRRFAHAASGPGSIALVAPGKKGSKSADDADERLSRPFDDNELRLTVRRLATAGRAPKVMAPVDDASRLTSRDLFGDLVTEVESFGAAKAPAAPAPRPSASTLSLDSQISNLRSEEKPKAPAAKRQSEGVDDLLSRTLSGLEVGDRVRRPAAPKVEPKPAAPAFSVAETVRIPLASAQATPPLRQPEPAPSQAPRPEAPKAEAPRVEAPGPETRAVEPPKPAPLPAKPVAPPPAAKAQAKKPTESRPAPLETTPARRATKDLDLSSLDALAKGKGKGGTGSGSADVLTTQKIGFPGGTAHRAGQGPMEFGQYTLLERIALGGMAEVWKASQKGVEGFQKIVAIKKILPHLTDSSDFVTMFIDEAKLAAQLNHTNIIHIYDLGKIGEDFFIAMEYVDGKDLRSILNAARDRKMALPLGLALHVGSRLASALDYAHRKKDFEGKQLGLVHRDVSPQNVLISFEGDIKLCDFGIVKAVSKASKTQMGALKGKLQYMSPEQAWGRPVDARSDIFSLGAVVFEMLTGQRLFTGESEMSVLDAVREGRVQAPRDLDPRLPLEVNALVLKALAKEPKGRFASGGDLQREIDAILASLKPAPTQRDLSLYMAKLFDTEPRVAAAESAPAAATPKVAVAAPAAPKPVLVAATPPPRAPEPALAPQPGGPDRPDAALESAPEGGKKMLWIALAAALGVAVVAWLLVGRGGSQPADAPSSAPGAVTAPESALPAAPAEQPAVTPASEAKPEAGAPAPATPEVKADDAAAKQREDEAKKKAEAAAEKQAAEATKPVPAEKTAVIAPVVPAEKAAVAEPTPAAPVEEPKPEPTPVVAQPAPARPTPTTPAPAVPKTPSVREGDLVTAGPGVRLPALVSFNKPEYPPIARRMKVEGTVVLSLLVDENGGVADVRLERGVSQTVGINEAAMKAARSAKYQPATKDGVRVKMWHTLTIPFKL